MDVGTWTLLWQRWLVLVALVGGALIVWTRGNDNFAQPKAELLVLVAVVLLALTVVRWSWTREIVVPASAPLAAAALFAVGLAISTLTSTSRLESVVGQYQQYDGLATYLACVVVFGITVRSFRREHVGWLLRSFVVAAIGVAGMGVLQMMGFDPFGVGSGNLVVSTLGNVDFVGGWLAVAIGPAIVLAARREEQPAWRIAAALAVVGGGIVLVGCGSFQGPVAGGAAALVAAVAVVLARRPLHRWWTRRNLVLAGACLVVVVAVAGAVGWSFVHRSVDEGMYDRRAFWSAAVDVVKDHPLVGTGPDTFHNQFLQRRPLGHVGNNAGAAHDVPLDMLANGGLVSGLPYLGFLVLIVVAIVRIWRRAKGGDLLLVGGLAAAWVGYLVQSLVSIDRPGLVVTHWVVAGVIASLAVTRQPVVIRLPGAVADGRQVRRGPGWLVPVALAAVLAGLAFVPLTRPIRATAATARANDALSRGDAATAIAQVEKARRLAPWEASHTYTATRVYAALGRGADVIREAEAGARLEPGDATYAIFAAQATAAAGDEARSARWWAEAVRRDPNGFTTIDEAGAAAARRNDRAGVRALAPKARRISNRAGLVAVARWYVILGDPASARRTYEELLRVAPGDVAAEKGLAELSR